MQNKAYLKSGNRALKQLEDYSIVIERLFPSLAQERTCETLGAFLSVKIEKKTNQHNGNIRHHLPYSVFRTPYLSTRSILCTNGTNRDLQQ